MTRAQQRALLCPDSPSQRFGPSRARGRLSSQSFELYWKVLEKKLEGIAPFQPVLGCSSIVAYSFFFFVTCWQTVSKFAAP